MADPLVLPVVPDAQQNRGVDLMLKGFESGLSGFAKMAEVNARNRQLELEAQRMVQAEKFHRDEQIFKYKNLDQEAALARIKVGGNTLYKDIQLERAIHGLEAAQIKAQRDQDVLNARREFEHDRDAFGITNPKTDPVKFHHGVEKLKAKWAAVNDPAIEQGVKVLDEVVKEKYSIPLRFGEKPDPKNPEASVGETTPKMVAIGEIVEKLKDKTTRPGMLDTLRNNRILEAGEETTTIGGKEVPTTESTDLFGESVPGKFKDILRPHIIAGKDVDFSNRPAPYKMRERSTAAQASDAALPQKTQEELAREWIEQHPDDPRAEIARRKLGL
jgi:hypothetical protein